jgi:hypothetical protein
MQRSSPGPACLHGSDAPSPSHSHCHAPWAWPHITNIELQALPEEAHHIFKEACKAGMQATRRIACMASQPLLAGAAGALNACACMHACTQVPRAALRVLPGGDLAFIDVIKYDPQQLRRSPYVLHVHTEIPALGDKVGWPSHEEANLCAACGTKRLSTEVLCLRYRSTCLRGAGGQGQPPRSHSCAVCAHRATSPG